MTECKILEFKNDVPREEEERKINQYLAKGYTLKTVLYTTGGWRIVYLVRKI